MPLSLPACPLPWSQSLSLPLPSVYWLLAPSLTWRIQERTFGYSFWAPESHNWRTGRNLVTLIVKASSNVDCFSPPLISLWFCKCHLGFFKSFLNQCLLFEKYSNLLHCWLLRELTLCPLFHCASLFTNAPRAVFLTDEGVGKVALKQTKIKQKKDSIKAAWDGNVHIPSIQIIYIYIWSGKIYIGRYISIYLYLPGFVSEPPLPSHKKGSWSLSRGKWASCRFKKLFPDPNRGAWTVPIMKWNEFSTAVEMPFSWPRQESPSVLTQKMSLSQMFHLLKVFLPFYFK